MTVELKSGESQDSLLKRFRKEVIKTRVLSTYRKKRWFVSKSEQRRLAKQRAIRKARRKMIRRTQNYQTKNQLFSLNLMWKEGEEMIRPLFVLNWGRALLDLQNRL